MGSKMFRGLIDDEAETYRRLKQAERIPTKYGPVFRANKNPIIIYQLKT